MSAPRIWGSLDPFFEPGQVLGRRVANEGFLRHLLRSGAFDEYHFFLAGQGEQDAVRSRLEQVAPELLHSGRARLLGRLELAPALARHAYHCFHLSDCMISQPHLARLRNLKSRQLFPITAPTHSLSYAGHLPALLAHLWPGATARECIVATSGPGAGVVERYFQVLRDNYGLSPQGFPGPSLRVVPLGLDVEDFAPPGEDERRAARQALHLADGQAVVLVFGRIQHHSKMDLLPLLRAFQRLFAAGVPRDSVRLVLAGWAEDHDELPGTLRALAANLGLELTMVLRPTAGERRRLFAAADIFCSPADNPQETFGLTMLEAGAMGLPVVAAEYDGYRDLVEHGVTGLLVPTLGATERPGGELDALSRVLFDNQYHLLLGQRTVVDVPALAAALRRLLEHPAERLALGRAAQQRVAEQFSWQAVVQRHLALWDELWAMPLSAQEEARVRAAAHPLQTPYARVFGHYTTAQLEPGLRLRTSAAGLAVYQQRDFPLVYGGLDGHVDLQALRGLLFAARRGQEAGALSDWLAANAGLEPEAAEFLLLWAMKQDYLERDE